MILFVSHCQIALEVPTEHVIIEGIPGGGGG